MHASESYEYHRMRILSKIVTRTSVDLHKLGTRDYAQLAEPQRAQTPGVCEPAALRRSNHRTASLARAAVFELWLQLPSNQNVRTV